MKSASNDRLFRGGIRRLLSDIGIQVSIYSVVVSTQAVVVHFGADKEIDVDAYQ